MSTLKDLQWTVGGFPFFKEIYFLPISLFSVTAAASDSEDVGSAFVRLNLGL